MPPATPRSSRRALRQLGSRLHWYARPCSSRDQEGANLQIRRRMRPTHFRNSLFPVLGEISQNRANDLLAERITRAAHSSGRVAGLPSGRVARRGYPPSCACPARLACMALALASASALALNCYIYCCWRIQCGLQIRRERRPRGGTFITLSPQVLPPGGCACGAAVFALPELFPVR